MKNLKEKIYESQEKSIVITLPSSVEWSDYEKELKAVEDESQVMNFKVPFLPSKTDRDYIKSAIYATKETLQDGRKYVGSKRREALTAQQQENIGKVTSYKELVSSTNQNNQFL